MKNEVLRLNTVSHYNKFEKCEQNMLEMTFEPP